MSSISISQYWTRLRTWSAGDYAWRSFRASGRCLTNFCVFCTSNLQSAYHWRLRHRKFVTCRGGRWEGGVRRSLSMQHPSSEFLVISDFDRSFLWVQWLMAPTFEESDGVHTHWNEMRHVPLVQYLLKITSRTQNSPPSPFCVKCFQTSKYLRDVFTSVFYPSLLLWVFVYDEIYNLHFNSEAWWWNLLVWCHHA